MNWLSRAALLKSVAFVLSLAAAQSVSANIGPKWTDRQLTDLSAAIVTGRVTGIATEWDPSVRSIYTYVTIDVDDVLKGAVESRQIVLKQAGGIVGEIGLHVSGQATFELDEEVLLFAEVRPRDLTLYTTALWQGKWTLERDARTGRRTAVQRDPEIRSGNNETDRREFSEMSLAIAERAVADLSPARFHAIPREAPAVSSGSQPFVFTSTPTRWMSLPVLVDVQAGGQPGLAGGGLGQLQNAVPQWNRAANFAYAARSINAARRCGNVFANSGVLTFVANDPCAEISNSGGVIAVAFSWFTNEVATTINGVNFRRTLEVTIISNDSDAAQRFITNTPCYQQVMLHESGHALGLGHTLVPGAVMEATVSFSQCSAGALNLQPDDIAGAQAIYPATSTPGGAPGTPTNVVAIPSGGILNVSWTAPGGSPAPTSYRLDFRSGSTIVATVLVGPNTSTSLAIPAGTQGTFTVTVTAIAGSTPGSPSAPATFTIGGGGGGGCTSAPPTPTGLNGGIAGGVASVSFAPSPGATSYIVQAGSSHGGSNLFNANIGNATAASAPVPSGFQAFVRVIAVNACGQSAPTADFVIGLTLGFGDLQATLSWNTATDIDLHVIEPNGRHVYWASPSGTTARLDRDDVDGFGPENIFVNAGGAAAGTYQIYIVHYSGGVPTTSQIQVRLNAGRVNERFAVFTRSTSGGNSGLGFNVADVNVGAGTITERGGTRAADQREAVGVIKNGR